MVGVSGEVGVGEISDVGGNVGWQAEYGGEKYAVAADGIRNKFQSADRNRMWMGSRINAEWCRKQGMDDTRCVNAWW